MKDDLEAFGKHWNEVHVSYQSVKPMTINLFGHPHLKPFNSNHRKQLFEVTEQNLPWWEDMKTFIKGSVKMETQDQWEELQSELLFCDSNRSSLETFHISLLLLSVCIYWNLEMLMEEPVLYALSLSFLCEKCLPSLKLKSNAFVLLCCENHTAFSQGLDSWICTCTLNRLSRVTGSRSP